VLPCPLLLRRGPLSPQRLTLESLLRAAAVGVDVRVPQIKGITVHPLQHCVVGPRVIVIDKKLVIDIENNIL
jgi:hypothetical protein